MSGFTITSGRLSVRIEPVRADLTVTRDLDPTHDWDWNLVVNITGPVPAVGPPAVVFEPAIFEQGVFTDAA